MSEFPQDGPITDGASISRLSASTFNLSAIGIYLRVVPRSRSLRRVS